MALSNDFDWLFLQFYHTVSNRYCSKTISSLGHSHQSWTQNDYLIKTLRYKNFIRRNYREMKNGVTLINFITSIDRSRSFLSIGSLNVIYEWLVWQKHSFLVEMIVIIVDIFQSINTTQVTSSTDLIDRIKNKIFVWSYYLNLRN